MTIDQNMRKGTIIANAEYWDKLMEDLHVVVGTCNSVTSAIAAHEHHDRYEAEELIDLVDTKVRSIRKLIEQHLSPI